MQLLNAQLPSVSLKSISSCRRAMRRKRRHLLKFQHIKKSAEVPEFDRNAVCSPREGLYRQHTVRHGVCAVQQLILNKGRSQGHCNRCAEVPACVFERKQSSRNAGGAVALFTQTTQIYFWNFVGALTAL